MQDEKGSPQPLTAADLIPNRALNKDDEDAFGYAAIAGRVADTLLVLEPPLTLGLFGPWGSGKSSMFELLRRELKNRKPKTRLVYYDASTYGGEALQRNFISHVAGELGYDTETYPDFHTGLYERTRRTDLDFAVVKKVWRPTLRLFAGAYLAFLFVFALLAGLTSVATNEDFVGEIARNLPRLIAPTAVAGLVVAVANLLLKGATVETEQSQPASDEAFAKTFQRLVERGVKDARFERLVVFVDELDRCSPQDVVATLSAIRTFLNDEHSVFVVAADRAAIERALKEKLPQSTPVDEENPYYSSTSSFFDKVFHDRVPLPPLRGPRLYEWAFGEVCNRGGYWGELRGEGEQDLRRVLYYLIPSHVRAPRRVRVLLNGFVRSASIAAHRGLDWKVRAREIAKLTVLDTEFTSVGADLRIEPRLPELLLSPPEAPSERVVRLLRKHGSHVVSRTSTSSRDDESPQEPSDEDIQAEEPTDEVLADVSDAEREALTHTEHEQLRRYLARTRDVRIGRDLLFLDAAGAAVGIEDVELGELLDEAVDDPARVIAALSDKDAETKRLAARVLGNAAEQEFGQERTNVISALMGIAADLDAGVADAADEVVGSVQSYMREEGLDEKHLVPALSLALAADNREMQDELFRDDRLLANEHVEAVTRMLPRIPNTRRMPVYEAVGRAISNDFVEPLTETLDDMPTEDATAFFEATPVRSAVARFLVAPEEAGKHDWLIKHVYSAADGHENGATLRRAAQRLLLHEEVAYTTLREHAERVFGEVEDPAERDRDALHALTFCPESDYEFWAGYLSSGEQESEELGRYGAAVARRFVEGLHAADAQTIDARRGLVDAVVPFVGMAPEDRQLVIRDTLTAELQSVPWWQDGQSTEGQERLHALGHALFKASELLRGELEIILAEDLTRAPFAVHELTAETLGGLRSMGRSLGRQATRVVTALESLGPSGAGALTTDVTLTRAVLACAAKQAGAAVEADVLDADEVVAAAATRTKAGRAALVAWLELQPGSAQVEKVIREHGDAAPFAVVEAVGAWAGNLSTEERTLLVQTLVEHEFDVTRWVGAIAQHQVDEEQVVGRLDEAIRAAGRGDRRELLASTLATIKPVTPDAQRTVADIVIFLVGSGKTVDFRAATKALPALGTQHRSAGRLKDAFKAAADDHDHQLSGRAADDLLQAGVRVPKKAVKKGVWDRLRDRFG